MLNERFHKIPTVTATDSIISIKAFAAFGIYSNLSLSFSFIIFSTFMKSVKLTQYLYTASLFFLIFLTAVCVAISAADVVIQALTDKTNTGQFDFRNLIVVGGSYLLLVTDPYFINKNKKVNQLVIGNGFIALFM